jgi:hypothetical protein
MIIDTFVQKSLLGDIVKYIIVDEFIYFIFGSTLVHYSALGATVVFDVHLGFRDPQFAF